MPFDLSSLIPIVGGISPQGGSPFLQGWAQAAQQAQQQQESQALADYRQGTLDVQNRRLDMQESSDAMNQRLNMANTIQQGLGGAQSVEDIDALVNFYSQFAGPLDFEPGWVQTMARPYRAQIPQRRAKAVYDSIVGNMDNDAIAEAWQSNQVWQIDGENRTLPELALAAGVPAPVMRPQEEPLTYGQLYPALAAGTTYENMEIPRNNQGIPQPDDKVLELLDPDAAEENKTTYDFSEYVHLRERTLGRPLSELELLKARTQWAQAGNVPDVIVSGSALDPVPESDTLWNSVSPAVTGPVSSIPQFLGGMGLNIAQPAVAARQRFDNAKSLMLRSLAENPRFPVAEREALAEEVNIEPGFFTAPDALRTRMVVIDKYLRRLETRRRNSGDLESSAAIEQFIERMGVPQGSGAAEPQVIQEVVMPDGTVRRFDAQGDPIP